MDALGLNIIDIVIYLVLFAGVYFVIKSKLVGPIVGMLDRRKAEVREASETRTRVLEEKQKIGKERHEILTQAKADARAAAIMIENNAHAEAKKILEKANTEAEQIIAKANAYLGSEKQRLQEQMQEQVAEGVRKSLNEIYRMDKKEIDRAMIDRVLKEMA